MHTTYIKCKTLASTSKIVKSKFEKLYENLNDNIKTTKFLQPFYMPPSRGDDENHERQ